MLHNFIQGDRLYVVSYRFLWLGSAAWFNNCLKIFTSAYKIKGDTMDTIAHIKQEGNYTTLYNQKGERLYRIYGIPLSHTDSIITIKKENGQIWELELVTHPFSPVYDEGSKVLILGSFPPPSSQSYGFYYGNRRNNFWHSLAEILNNKAPHDILQSTHTTKPTHNTPAIYDSLKAKKAFLFTHKIALWDIIKSCMRKKDSSSDSDIVISSIIPNDLTEIFKNAPNIKVVITTGNLASRMYQKHYGKGFFAKGFGTKRDGERENESRGKNEGRGIMSNENGGRICQDSDYQSTNPRSKTRGYNSKDYRHDALYPLHIPICSSSQRNQKRNFRDELRQALQNL